MVDREGVVEGVSEAVLEVDTVPDCEAVLVGVGVAVRDLVAVCEVVADCVPVGLRDAVLEHDGAALKPGAVQVERQGQGKHAAAEVAPRVELYFPASHSVQAEAPAVEYDPAGHMFSVAVHEPAGQK